MENSTALSPERLHQLNASQLLELLKDADYRVVNQRDESAESTIVEILRNAHRLQDRDLLVNTYCSLSAFQHNIRFDDVKSMEYAQQAIEYLGEGCTDETEMCAMYHLGLAYYVLGQYVKAQQSLLRAINVYYDSQQHTEPMKELMSAALRNTGITFFHLGLYNIASRYNDPALEFAYESGVNTMICQALSSKAIYLFWQLEYDKAKAALEEVLRLFETDEENEQIAMALHYLGLIHIEQNNLDRAQQELHRAFDIREKIGNEFRHTFSYYALARLYYAKGEVERGEQYERLLKDLFQRYKTRVSPASLLRTEYDLLGAKGEYRKAFEWQQQHPPLLSVSRLVEDVFDLNIENERQKQQAMSREADELRLINREMSDYSRLLESSNKDLKSFAHSTSHDLREPLRMVSAYMTILETKLRDKLTEEEKKFLHFAVDGARRMDEMIQRLLQNAKQLNAAFKPVDLQMVVARVQQNLAALILEKKAVIYAHKLLPIAGDDMLLLQLIQNLVSNAIKYNTSPIPSVNICCADNENERVLCISDNGVGIPESEREKVFEIFQRVQNASGAEGSGIGLSTCKSIVEKMKGRIWIEDNTGGGTLFKISFPVPTNVHT